MKTNKSNLLRTVKSCTNTDAKYINLDALFKEAIDKLSNSQTGHITIKKGDRTQGILSWDKVLKIIHENGYSAKDKIGNFMDKNVILIPSDAYIHDAMTLMLTHEVKILVVVEEGIEIGIITFEDLLLEVQNELSGYFDNLKNIISEKSEQIDKLLELKEEYLTVAAHDLKSPLSIIKGFANILLDENNLLEDQKVCLKYIDEQCDDLLSLVNDLLSTVNLESGGLILNKTEVNLNNFLKSIYEGFSILSKKNKIELTLDCEKNIKYSMDRSKIRECIVNLLDNALKYTKKGEISIKCKKHDDGILISISDTGIGLKEEQRKNIFNKYFVVSENKNAGYGLGLYITNQIVKAHGGKIDIKSEYGKGSTFSINLP